MNTQDMDRLVSEYHAYIQNAERYGADQAFKAEALNYQWAAEICSRLVERTTGAEAQEWLKKLAACEKKTRKLWTELYTRVRKSEPETGSADDSACGTQAEEPDKTAAEQKDADACYWSGLCCYHGYGMEQDYTQAVEWFRKAADQNPALTAELYRRAAEQGNRYAMRLLGNCYCSGQGVDRDYHQAVEWYCKAAELGDGDACYWLGRCCASGRGVDRDYALAVRCFRKAAELGDKDACCWLGNYYCSGEDVEKDEAQAAQWYRKAAELGDRHACYWFAI